MDTRRRRSSRIDRWLREITDTDKQAAPLDFSEVAILSRHNCEASEDGGRQSKGVCLLRAPPVTVVHGDTILTSPPVQQQLAQPQPPQQLQQTQLPSSSSGSKVITSSVPVSISVANKQPPTAVSDSPLSTGSSSRSTSLEFTSTESNTDLKQSSHSSSLASSLDSNKLKVVRREQQQQQQVTQQQPQPQPKPHQRQHAKPTCQGASGDGGPPGTVVEKAGTSTSSKEAPVGVTYFTYYFHLSKNFSKERSQELLGHMKSLRESDRPLQQISANRGVTITLGRKVEPTPGGSQSNSSYRRKVVIQGANWRSVMESVNDLSLAYPDLMSQAGSSLSAGAKPVAEPTHTASVPRQRKSDQKVQSQHPHQQQQQQQQRLSNASQVGAGAAKLLSSQQHQQPQPHASAKPPPQPPPQLPPLPPPQPPSQPSASAATATVAALIGATASAAPSVNQSVKASGRPTKLAQNVRFQLTTSQREGLFTQDESGKPTHPRLRHLLTSLRMDLVFLERSINQDKVPSVKVRFFFENFDQLTAFCKAIDYQIPSQG